MTELAVEVAFWADDWPTPRHAERPAPDVALAPLGAALAARLATRGAGRLIAIAPGARWSIDVGLAGPDRLDELALALRELGAPRSTVLHVAGTPPRPLHPRLRDF